MGALSPRELAQAPGELAPSSRLSHLGRQLAHVRLFMGRVSSYFVLAGSLFCSEKVWATSHPQQPGLSRLQRLCSYSEDMDPSRNRWERQRGLLCTWAGRLEVPSKSVWPSLRPKCSCLATQTCSASLRALACHEASLAPDIWLYPWWLEVRFTPGWVATYSYRPGRVRQPLVGG